MRITISSRLDDIQLKENMSIEDRQFLLALKTHLEENWQVGNSDYDKIMEESESHEIR